ncbi:regulator of G protein signaling domain-domain-containing protein [Syncephalastrum racemosum]|uniref:Regulator of G protein signaling domain-domain-containing protein n=1 Tax=Syncephalastrum racemosum TaxID=13706 RepID=A0A1X2H0R1_SYNRA|nr:regulator of G protein signaling domain-domain-containing protein [Syncephalastrum racemosum]
MDPGISQQAYTSMMKFTIDGRPYLKDIHDLFAALIVQIPLDNHRYLFRNYPNTYTSEDAIQALGSLKFSYTARTPDPNDPSKLLRTTTTTTFNMEKDMAKALCQQFQVCRLTENATDPQSRNFREKGLWQLTPKGLCVLQDFCVRTEADMSQLRKQFGTVDAIQLVRLERHPDDDQIVFGRQNLSIVFRIMVTHLPLEGELPTHNQKSSPVKQHNSNGTVVDMSSKSSQSSGSSTTGASSAAPFAMATQIAAAGDSRVQLLANNLLTVSKKSRQNHARSLKNMRTVFSTQLCCDWLTDYSTVSSRDEAESLASEFIKYGKSLTLVITAKGKEVVAEVDPNSSQQQQQQQGATTSTGHSGNGSQASLPGGLSRSRSSAHSSLSRQQQSNDDDDKPTTLREMLQQEADNGNSKAHAQASAATPSSDDVENRKPSPQARPRNNNNSNNNQPDSRPSSAAIDYEAKSLSLAEDPKESNAARLKVILDDPQLRSLFKDFLRANFCEENLDFWIDYSTLRRKCRNQSPAMPSQNQKDLLEDAYDIWSTYLAPGAQCELNVEHSLIQEMARVVQSMVQVVPTYTPGQSKPSVVISTPSTSQSLRMMLKWFDRVNDHICRLMASDSVPKFVKTPKYRKIMDARERKGALDDTNSEKTELLYGPSIVENRA